VHRQQLELEIDVVMMPPQIAWCLKIGMSPCPIHEQPNCQIRWLSLEKENNEQDHLLELDIITIPNLNARRKEINTMINIQQAWCEAVICMHHS
jgi:hypothetical protein